tara:strand:- start:2160 stop:2501 length:342 start_codon:yes stop_codon:yes gene_type:complete
MAKNNYRTTFTGVTTAGDDTNALADSSLVKLDDSGGTTTVGTPWELNVVERGHASSVAAPVYTGDDAAKIAQSEALTIMNISGRFLKQHLGNTNYTTTKVKKIILTVEMGAAD